jgi:hypothetical protein
MSAVETANRIQAAFTLLGADTTEGLKVSGSGFVQDSAQRVGVGQYLVKLETELTDPTVFPVEQMVVASGMTQPGISSRIVNAVPIQFGGAGNPWEHLLLTQVDVDGAPQDFPSPFSVLVFRFPNVE